MAHEPIVAVALLTQKQVNWLGSGLKKVYRLEDTTRFAALIAELDAAGRERQC